MKPNSLVLGIWICAATLSPAAFASDCPNAPDHMDALDQLFDRLEEAPDDLSARLISNEFWALWADAPDEAAQEVLERGMRSRASHDFVNAVEAFDRLIEYCPNYAEGYNQRAFVRFIQQDYAAALVDLDRAIVLSPRHFAAIAGRALSLMGLGRNEEAQESLRTAVELNPWLPERHLLQDALGEEL